jgi:polyphosphate kinase
VSLRRELSSLLDLLLADNTNAWELNSRGAWQRITRNKGERRRSAQLQLMRRHEHDTGHTVST